MQQSSELFHEKHNRITLELSQRIIIEFPEFETQLIRGYWTCRTQKGAA
jgi:hypothetical protein